MFVEAHMKSRKSEGIRYHLWNAYTEMETFEEFLGLGPSIITRGEGCYLYNQRGQRYINANSCIWNFPLGYGREEIVDAASRQMRELPFSSCWQKAHPRAMELAAKLVEITSGNFAHAMLGSSGTEAVEAALKISRQYHRQSPDGKDRRRFKIISLRGSYHGFAYGAATLPGSADYEAKFGPMVPGIVSIGPPYCYRCPYQKESYPDCGLSCAQELEKTILAEDPLTVAAFIMEPVMGELGAVAPPDEYCRRVGEICKRYGLLFIADEVTTGFGRTGRLFASQDWSHQPDILCLGKAISGGYLPLSATLVTDEIFQRFIGMDRYFTHGSTDSGQPVCAAVGLKAIEIILREKLPERAAELGAYLKSSLVSLMDSHPMIGDVRGIGLMLAIEFTKDRKAKEPLTQAECLDVWLDILLRGLDVGFSDRGIILMPPFVIERKLVDEMVDLLDKALHMGPLASLDRTARQAKEFALFKLKP
jgi:adenosylmethionine-8-amino-7-oxononanoate aminotransferase